MSNSLLRTRALTSQISRSSARQLTTMSQQKEESGILKWADKSGEFKRQVSSWRNFISDKPGAEFPAEKNRYRLYVSYACPWAHRTLLVRKLKGLEEIIPYTAVHWHMGDQGWRFAQKDENIPGENVTTDPLHPDFTHLRQLYFAESPGYKGRFTVPVLYDTIQKRIVNNESAEIIRMFYGAFDSLLSADKKAPEVDLLPTDLEKAIDEANNWIYDDVNNGVYKSGFATSQEAYEKAVTQLFKSLDRIEDHLEGSGPYWFGERLTEVDVRLYTTIIRFDAVYVQHFKTNLRDIRSGYPAIHKWVRNLYWNSSAFKDTTQFEHIKKHYTKSHLQINPYSITPLGPVPDILPLDEEVNAAKGALK